MGRTDTTTEAARFTRTRAAHRDEIAEDYAEAIEQLVRTHGAARVVELARFMGVSHVTASRTVGRMVRQGLVAARPTGVRGVRPAPAIELTAEGRRLASRSRQRHDTVVSFLVWLGVPRRQAEIDAEGIEHHVSEATIRAMRRATGDGPRPRDAAP